MVRKMDKIVSNDSKVFKLIQIQIGLKNVKQYMINTCSKMPQWWDNAGAVCNSSMVYDTKFMMNDA